jgi:hypothetical protein
MDRIGLTFDEHVDVKLRPPAGADRAMSRMPVTGEFLGPEVVGHDDDDVERPIVGRSSRRQQAAKAEDGTKTEAHRGGHEDLPGKANQWRLRRLHSRSQAGAARIDIRRRSWGSGVDIRGSIRYCWRVARRWFAADDLEALDAEELPEEEVTEWV